MFRVSYIMFTWFFLRPDKGSTTCSVVLNNSPCGLTDHDDVIIWKHFPRYWPFVRGIHRSPVNSPHESQWRGALLFSLTCALNKRLSKQSRGWWFETPMRSLWRHCTVKGHHWFNWIMIWCHIGDKPLSQADLGLRRANERRRYFVTTSLIGWVQA